MILQIVFAVQKITREFVNQLVKFDGIPFDHGADNIKHITSPVLLILGDNDVLTSITLRKCTGFAVAAFLVYGRIAQITISYTSWKDARKLMMETETRIHYRSIFE